MTKLENHTYLGMVIFTREGKDIAHTKTFTYPAHRLWPDEFEAFDTWSAGLLKEHGNTNCRLYYTRLLWAIGGN